jgi:hypothetical protein
MTDEMFQNIMRLVEAIQAESQPQTTLKTGLETFPQENRSESQKPFDPRKEAVNSFSSFLDAADQAGKHDVTKLENDKIRIPIAANSGTAGSGKTTQLEILCDEFSKLRAGGKFVYCTMGGDNACDSSCDASCPVAVRMAHRIIHAALNQREIKLTGFWTSVRYRLGMAELGVRPRGPNQEGMERVLAEPLAVVEVCRRLLNMEDSAPLLIAVDELRKLGDGEPEVGEVSEVAVEALKYLASLSQRSFVQQHYSGTKPTYVVGSAYTALDPAKGVTEGSNRPVHFLPLPPLKLSYGWDAEICEAAGWTLCFVNCSLPNKRKNENGKIFRRGEEHTDH